ncbi:MAG: protoporphyrinogen oxidase [Acidobacteriota bacterium]|nr:protoporphyrinogen oxidase [Acidobacteriota bacterium]MDE3043238.1 protoporphyrinogen oxidase [Acidobacteriota bacterium]MDE3106560.1 protoporphyrinogen oxidase [Acidobacteriota bacterium]
MRASVVVVGAGVSGLAVAWELSGGVDGPNDHTPRVEVLDVAERVGGSLSATDFAGRRVDLGPDGFLARRPEAVELVRELGLENDLVAIGAAGATIFLRGALYPLPAGLALGIPTTLAQVRAVPGLTWRARLAAARDLLVPRRLEVGDDASVGAIVRAKLGRELTYRFIEPMVGGIQAGRVDALSAKSVYPGLLEAARKGGSLMKALRAPSPPTSPAPDAPTPVFYSLHGGLGSLPVTLRAQLEARGVVVRTGVGVNALRRTPVGTYPVEVDTATTTTPANAVIVATPAHVAGALLGRFHEDLAALAHVDSAGAAMVTFSLAPTALPPGTGVLVPLQTPWRDGESMMVTALTFLDRKWPYLAREHDVLVRAHVGRVDDDRWTRMSDEELTARVYDELSTLLGGVGVALETRVQRWPTSLPQYYVGHDVMVRRARDAARPLGVELAGMTYDGVGVPASIGSGRRAARAVLTRLRETS